MMSKSIENKILNTIENSPVAMLPKSIFEILKLENKEQFLKSIYNLESEGKIFITKKGKVISSKLFGRIPAKIISQSKSFAFASSIEDSNDIYISSKDLKNAVLGDLVLIHKIRNSPRGLNGVVERILKKGSRTLTGTVLRINHKYEIIPDDAFRFNIPILKGYTMGARNGDKVKAVLSSSPQRSFLGAKIVKIYGKSTSARICSDAIIDSYSIPSIFPEKVINEAKKISSISIDDSDLKSRLDLRHELIFTIDGEDAKDLDDAISLKRDGENGWILGVHIADVSHYIRANSNLDKEAFNRGTSVYFADRVIPMLPKEISNGICSLNANEDKLTFSAIMKIDNKGKLLSYEFRKSIINSKVRGVYSEINDIISNNSNPYINKKYEKVLDIILEAKKLSDLMTQNAKKRGVMDIESGESRFFLDSNGICIDVKPRVQGEAEKIIENFMIIANQAAALYAKSALIPFIYRVHEEPNPLKLRTLNQLANALGLKCHRMKNGLSQADLSSLLNQTIGTPKHKIISHQILRTMAKARYDSEPIGHFGLALEDYCHFTSPIRRYPDTCIHRILSDLVLGYNINNISKKYSDFTEDAAKQSSICEIRAMKAERDAEKCYMAEFIGHCIGEIFDGIISGVNSKGIFVELKNSIEGFLDLYHYKNCKFSFDGLTCHTDLLSGKKLSIGNNIKVRVTSADVASGSIEFEPVDEL